MIYQHLQTISFTILISTCLSTAYLLDPPTPAAPDTIPDCSSWHVARPGDTCTSIVARWLNTYNQFRHYNPSIGPSCTLIPGISYCIQHNWGNKPPLPSTPTEIPVENQVMISPSTLIPQPCSFNRRGGIYLCPSSTSSSSPSTPPPSFPTPSTPTTTTTTTITTPTPFQQGLTPNCKSFYKVVRDDGCWAIAREHGIDLEDFLAWNPGAGPACGTLWEGAWVCVGD